MAHSSYYRTPSKAPATKWARHIDAWMRREGLSQTGAFRKLRGAFGLGEESRSAFLPYLVNKPLDETQQAAVAAIIGWPPEPLEEPMKEPGGADLTGLIAALANALQAQAQTLTDIRLALAQAARDAQSERLATAALMGHLSDQLDELRELAGRPDGSSVPGSDRHRHEAQAVVAGTSGNLSPLHPSLSAASASAGPRNPITGGSSSR